MRRRLLQARRAGLGRANDTLRIFSGNVTRHGTKDVQYLRDHFDELDAWAMCELHVAADRAEAVGQAFLKDGWKARIAPGQRSQAWQQAGRGAATAGPGPRRCRDAVEGGVGLGVKKHLSTTWVPSSLIEGMEDIEAAVLHLKGLKLLVVSL